MDHRLRLDDVDLVDLASRFGTPLYVVSEAQLRGNYRRFRDAFAAGWPHGPVRVLPSLKANLSLALRHVLTAEGAGCDTFGPGELTAALASGVPGPLISVNGPQKSDAHLARAIGAGARITVDSVPEIARTRAAARAQGRRAIVRFRVRPDYTGLDRPSDFATDGTSVREAADRYKAGIPTEDLLAAGPEALAAPELDVRGAMVHLGRHAPELDVWRSMVRSFVDTVAELSRAWGGWRPAELDLGGGFASPRDPTSPIPVPGGTPLPAPRAPSIEEYADALTGTLAEALSGRGIEPAGIALELEPGRSLYADAGVHLTRIGNVKRQTRPTPRRWIEVDTSEMFLLDSLIEHNRWVPVLADRADAAPDLPADVVGISCGFDLIVPDAQLPPARVGDTIAFLDTGAYQDACANNFNALPRPATVLVHGSDADLIRRAETIDDVLRRDVVPERLKPPAGAR